MDTNEREEGKERKEGLSKIVLSVEQSINKLNSLSEDLRGYLDRMEKFKDEVDELISCIDAQSEELEELWNNIGDGVLDTCSKCGELIEDADIYEVKTPKGKKVFLCTSCFYKK